MQKRWKFYEKMMKNIPNQPLRYANLAKLQN